MRNLLFVFLLTGTCFSAFPSGIIIVDADNKTLLPNTETTVSITINGQVAEVTTRQVFINPYATDTLVKYAFPLGETASFTHLSYYQDQIWIQAYFTPQPQDTSLPSSSGGTANDLTTYLGETPFFFNLPNQLAPGDTLIIEFTYVELLSYLSNEVSLIYPSTLSDLTGQPLDSFNLNIDLFSQRQITGLQFDNLPGAIYTNTGNHATASFTSISFTATEHIRFIYSLDANQLGLFDYSTYMGISDPGCDSIGAGYFAFIVEPDPNDSNAIVPKDFILIIDESGSMNGSKIQQAKDAATFIVNNLNFGDHFNIVRFESTVSSFKPSLVPYNLTTQQQALQYINAISSGGMTNISGSFSTGLPNFQNSDPNAPDIVIFFTDGQATAGITSTPAILQHVLQLAQTYSPQVHIYSFGIGTGANQDLLNQLSAQHDGLAFFVQNQDLYTSISNFYLLIQNPVLINPSIAFNPDIIYATYPDPLPNLYIGQQMVLVGRYEQSDSLTITFTGDQNGTTAVYNYDVALADSLIPEHLFLPKLWAQFRIKDLMKQYYTASLSQVKDSLKSLVVETSLCYQVGSPFTSLGGIGNGGGGGISTGLEEYNETESLPKLHVFPNPFREATTIEIPVVLTGGSDPIILEIYDLTGRLIFKQIFHTLSTQAVLKWNGTNQSGGLVERGIYWITLKAGDQQFGTLINRQ